MKPTRYPEANWVDRPSGFYWIEDDRYRNAGPIPGAHAQWHQVAEFVSGAGKPDTGYWIFAGSEQEIYVYAAKGFRVISRRLKEPSQ